MANKPVLLKDNMHFLHSFVNLRTGIHLHWFVSPRTGTEHKIET